MTKRHFAPPPIPPIRKPAVHAPPPVAQMKVIPGAVATRGAVHAPMAQTRPSMKFGNSPAQMKSLSMDGAPQRVHLAPATKFGISAIQKLPAQALRFHEPPPTKFGASVLSIKTIQRHPARNAASEAKNINGLRHISTKQPNVIMCMDKKLSQLPLYKEYDVIKGIKSAFGKKPPFPDKIKQSFIDDKLEHALRNNKACQSVAIGGVTGAGTKEAITGILSIGSALNNCGDGRMLAGIIGAVHKGGFDMEKLGYDFDDDVPITLSCYRLLVCGRNRRRQGGGHGLRGF